MCAYMCVYKLQATTLRSLAATKTGTASNTEHPGHVRQISCIIVPVRQSLLTEIKFI